LAYPPLFTLTVRQPERVIATAGYERTIGELTMPRKILPAFTAAVLLGGATLASDASALPGPSKDLATIPQARAVEPAMYIERRNQGGFLGNLNRSINQMKLRRDIFRFRRR
jgi:hypothetical protein